MLGTPKDPKPDRIATQVEQPIVDVGVQTHPSSQVVLPPVKELLKGKVLSLFPKAIEFQMPDDQLSLSLEATLDRLMTQHHEFEDSPNFVSRLSGLAASCGRFEAASDLAKRSVDLDRERGDLAYRLAEVSFLAGRHNEAESLWSEQAGAGHLLSCLRMAEMAVRRANLNDAGDWLAQAVSIDTSDWRVVTFAGILALLQSDGNRAVSYFRSALEDRPRSARLQYNLALAHVLTGNPKNAIKAVRKAIGLNPFMKPALMVWADLDDDVEKPYAGIVDAFARYIDLYPRDNVTIKRLAQYWYFRGNDKECRRLLLQARNNAPDPAILNNLGVLACKRKDFNVAVREFYSSIDLSGVTNESSGSNDFGTATANLVNALNEAGKFSEAAKVCIAYARSINDPSFLTNKPSSLVAEGLLTADIGRGKVQRAVTTANQWIKVPELDDDLYWRVSELLVYHYTIGEWEPEKAIVIAEQAYNHMLAGKSIGIERQITLLNNLAFVAVELDRLDEAKVYLQQLGGQISKSKEFVCATRGLLTIRMGRVERGEALYRHAIAIAHKQRDKAMLRQKLNFELGTFFASKGERTKAARAFRRVLNTKLDGSWTMSHLRTRSKDMLASL